MSPVKAAISVALLAALLFGADAYGRRWLEQSHDFGTIHETQGKVPAAVRVVNDSDSALLIRRVKSTCGCTDVDFDRPPIAPGDTGVVRFSYNPAGRPGPFEKHIKVYFDAETVPEDILITGTVISTPDDYRDKFPISLGALMLERDNVDFGEISVESYPVAYVMAFNPSSDTLSLVQKGPRQGDLPADMRFSTNSLAPGRFATIGLYVGSHDAPVGPSESVFTLCQGDSCIDMRVAATMLPRAKRPSGQAPECVISPSVVDMGEIKPGAKKKLVIDIKNDGDAPLSILKVYSESTALTVKRAPSRLLPGKKADLTIECLVPQSDTAPAFGATLNVVSDDPLQPVKSIRIVGLYKTN